MQHFFDNHCFEIFLSFIFCGVHIAKSAVEEIISLNRVHDYNRDMFALRYPLNINYRSFETLVLGTLVFWKKSCRVEIAL